MGDIGRGSPQDRNVASLAVRRSPDGRDRDRSRRLPQSSGVEGGSRGSCRQHIASAGAVSAEYKFRRGEGGSPDEADRWDTWGCECSAVMVRWCDGAITEPDCPSMQ